MVVSFIGGIWGYVFKPRFVLYQDSSHILIFGPTGSGLIETLNSSDGGENWVSYDTTQNPANLSYVGASFVDVNTGMYAINVGVPGKDLPFLYKTTNGGKTWNLLGTYGEFIIGDWSDRFEVIFCLNSNIYFVVQGNGHILRSNDGGETWASQVDTGIIYLLKKVFFSDSLNGFVVGNRGIIIHTTTGRKTPKLSDLYLLKQNYPNPFNVSTTIEYSIPKQSHVVIKVFDVLGREMTTLVNEETPEGYYKINFDGNNLSSGIYFYRMEARSFSETKKLILVK